MLQKVEPARQKMADYTTPLVRNCWYVAALGSEIGRELKERTLLGKSVLMYRTEEGQPVIMQNRCPHRNFPLSKGRLDGDKVVCGYHGMNFDPKGNCVFMPSMAKAPTHVTIASYPVIEQGPLVWVWMGDPAKADPASVPQTPWLSAPDWKTVSGQFHVGTNYVAMHENLLDQTHFPILHSSTGIGTPEYSRATLEVRVVGDTVEQTRSLLNSPPPDIYGIPTRLTGRPVDRFSDAAFASPAWHVAHARIVNLEPREGEKREYRFTITHIYTPEHQNTIHYWWFNSRNCNIDDTAVDQYLHDASIKAYKEDVDALTWIQQEVEKESEPIEEASFAPDRPGIAMRKILLRLAAEEAAQDASMAA
ncbi:MULTISPECIES: aromatic ring-hydroxylating dioxygenase subunit alpha [unclassified Herbaspirillum]|uniref:aromatic ring-hydroxylating dioxygenase subunit alpha n=1 Tax=unclassified Herbaspirillum TaxID=2624150 RepID=UPI0011546EBD|nr:MULTISPECIES: aromatic ring-hydroxylating dioxygenase subunit alpha [unclassified Herbaspirillum]MBB5393786.1 vanillate O-demethylase monooxygenase subunit [Herbaspirillum sp. SJZ102]TQK01354.1 vanillate O-demethylase monooxygenase subunit [Herbaspirillum sp. SJZ130]TQK05750.1 vanillate O-demethylase monooxygenase subunit [Herbaspirillum sp. SJZ106]